MRYKKINVRWATEDDKPAISKMLHGLMVYTASLYGKEESSVRSEDDILAGLDSAFRSNVRFVVAEVDGVPAGMCGVESSYSTWHAKPYIIVNDLFVVHNFRRQGVATELLEFVTTHAEATECSRVDLFVENPNLSAQALYHSFGFDELQQTVFSIRIYPTPGVP